MAPTVPPAFSTAATTTSPGRPPRHHLAVPASAATSPRRPRARALTPPGGRRSPREGRRDRDRAATSPRRPSPHAMLEGEKGKGARSPGRGGRQDPGLLHHHRRHHHLATPASAAASTLPTPPRGEEGKRGEPPGWMDRALDGKNSWLGSIKKPAPII